MYGVKEDLPKRGVNIEMMSIQASKREKYTAWNKLRKQRIINMGNRTSKHAKDKTYANRLHGSNVRK